MGISVYAPVRAERVSTGHPAMLRFTDTEYERLSAHAKATNPPLAEYIQKQITGKRITVKYKIVADPPEYHRYL